MPFDPRTIDEHPDIIVIDGAIEALRRCGWRQGALGNERSGFCLLGALEHSRHQCGHAPNPLDTHSAVTLALLRRRGVRGDTSEVVRLAVPGFNDATTTTKRKALLFLRSCRNAVARKLLIGA